MRIDLQKEFQIQYTDYERYYKFELLKEPTYSKLKPKSRKKYLNPNFKSTISSLHASYSSPQYNKNSFIPSSKVIQSEPRFQNCQQKRSVELFKKKNYRTITLQYDCPKNKFFEQNSADGGSYAYRNSQILRKNILRKNKYENRTIKQRKIKDCSYQINGRSYYRKDAHYFPKNNSLYLQNSIKSRQKEQKKTSFIINMPKITQLLHKKDTDLDTQEKKQLRKCQQFNKNNKAQKSYHRLYEVQQLEHKTLVPQPW